MNPEELRNEILRSVMDSRLAASADSDREHGGQGRHEGREGQERHERRGGQEGQEG